VCVCVSFDTALDTCSKLVLIQLNTTNYAGEISQLVSSYHPVMTLFLRTLK